MGTGAPGIGCPGLKQRDWPLKAWSGKACPALDAGCEAPSEKTMPKQEAKA